MSEEEKRETKRIHDANLSEALSLVEDGNCELLMLDEALDAYQLGLLDEALLKQIILHKPEALELVITGHTPTDWIMERADYITEMVKHKHPYDQGIHARRGIEF
jgi:cob(I)alamin adenosyltransferase